MHQFVACSNYLFWAIKICRALSTVINGVMGSPGLAQCTSKRVKVQGSETKTMELLGGTNENNILPNEGSLGDFSQKGDRQKLSKLPDLVV